MSVRSEVVKQTLVATICDRVVARLKGELPEAVVPALAGTPDAARMGYFTRVVEWELFEPARSPLPGLGERLRVLDGDADWAGAAAAVARELASREPLERPDPADPDAVSWQVPGPGGHVRHYVARRLVGERPRALKRDFMYGFLVRCCEEALIPR